MIPQCITNKDIRANGPAFIEALKQQLQEKDQNLDVEIKPLID